MVNWAMQQNVQQNTKKRLCLFVHIASSMFLLCYFDFFIIYCVVAIVYSTIV